LFRIAFTAVLAASAALAGPITYTFNTTATGTFGGTPFTDAAVTVTSVADTSTAVESGTSPDYVWDNYPTSTTITIAGFAPATFTDQTFWEDPNDSGDIIFGIVATDTAGLAFCIPCHALLGMTLVLSPLVTYNLQSAIGPLSFYYDFETEAFNAFQNISTSGGTLSLVAMDDTFTATTPTPEPASFLIAGLGLLGLCAIRLKKGLPQFLTTRNN
jgi:hypothetical protein